MSKQQFLDEGDQYLAHLAERVSHLYPKPQLPENKQDWTIGHKCLEYFNRVLPLKGLLLPTYLNLLLERANAGVGPVPIVKPETFQEACVFGFEIMKFVRYFNPKDLSVCMLKSNRAACCGELSWLAYQWMKEQGCNSCLVASDFYDGGKAVDYGHQFVVFHRDKKARLSCQQMLSQLDNPDIWICDIWTGKSLSAKEMLNEYSHLFVYKDAQGIYRPMADGFQFVVNDVFHQRNKYTVATVAQGAENTMRLTPVPQPFQTLQMPHRRGNEGR